MMVMEPVVGTVVVGYGRGEAGDRAVTTAADLAVRLSTELLVVHVVDAGDYPVDPDSASFEAEAQDALGVAHDHVAALMGGLADGPEWKQRTERGDPVTVLAELAESCSASMIVVGSRGGGPGGLLSRVLEPSVSHGLIRHQTRPVLVVPAGH
ncbi:MULTISPECIES: universal stress protein [Pseudonocardia]